MMSTTHHLWHRRTVFFVLLSSIFNVFCQFVPFTFQVRFLRTVRLQCQHTHSNHSFNTHISTTKLSTNSYDDDREVSLEAASCANQIRGQRGLAWLTKSFFEWRRMPFLLMKPVFGSVFRVRSPLECKVVNRESSSINLSPGGKFRKILKKFF